MEATLFLRAEDANYREDTAVVFWEILIQQTHGGPKDSRTIPGKAERAFQRLLLPGVTAEDALEAVNQGLET